jgi:hypothetical protein
MERSIRDCILSLCQYIVLGKRSFLDGGISVKMGQEKNTFCIHNAYEVE